MINTLPTPTTHETDLPLGAYAFHGQTVVRIFGRERDEKTGIIKHYWVVRDECAKNEKRYQVSAKLLRA